MIVQWGDVATWVAGGVTVAAVVVALVTSSRAHKLATDEARDREQEREDDRAAQARTVLARLHTSYGMNAATEEGSAESGYDELMVTVQNYGDRPILAVEVRAAVVQGPVRYQALPIRGDLPHWASIPAGGSENAKVVLDGDYIRADDDLSVIVDFVDAAGIRWRRWGNVDPERAPSQPQRHVRPAGVDWPA